MRNVSCLAREYNEMASARALYYAVSGVALQVEQPEVSKTGRDVLHSWQMKSRPQRESPAAAR